MNLTVTSISLNQEFDELVKQLAEKQLITNDSNKENNPPDMTDESAKRSDFFQSNKQSQKKSARKYTTTRIKSRNFLSNIYVRINKEDSYNQNFLFNIYLLMVKSLNPFSLDRKLSDLNKHEMVYMIWTECMPAAFYKYICKEENFIYLNGKNILQPKLSEILTNFLVEDEKKLCALEK